MSANICFLLLVGPVYCFWFSLFLAFGWPCFLPLVGPLGSRAQDENESQKEPPSQAQPSCPTVLSVDMCFLPLAHTWGHQGLPYSRASYIGHIATRLFSLVATCEAGAGGYRGRDIDRFIDVYMCMHTYIHSTHTIYVLLL